MSEVFILTRPYERGILGVYSKREYAERHRDQCFDPHEMEIEKHVIDSRLDELDDDCEPSD